MSATRHISQLVIVVAAIALAFAATPIRQAAAAAEGTCQTDPYYLALTAHCNKPPAATQSAKSTTRARSRHASTRRKATPSTQSKRPCQNPYYQVSCAGH
jgi:hypothetical protein